MNDRILVIQTARAGSKSVPNKNIAYVNEEKMLFQIPLCKIIDNKTENIDVCISTDCDTITKTYKHHELISIVERPEHLSQDNSSHHDAMIHALNEMEEINKTVYDFIVVLLGNSVGVDLSTIIESIDEIKKTNSTGAMTVSKFNMFNPYRAFKIDNNEIKTHISVPDNSNDKNCLGDVYFFNGSCFVCKRDVLLSKKGNNPFPWVGNKILPIVEEKPKMEVDDHWQLAHLRRDYNKLWPKYLSKQEKENIENIELVSNQWSGYKNVEFNISIWENLISELDKYSQTKVNVLDYGFGPGWSKIVSRNFEKVEITGLDIDLPKQNLEFKKFHSVTNIKSDRWDGLKMPYEDNTFDAIMAKASVTKLRNTTGEIMINELVRISKPGAKWIIGPEYMMHRFYNEIAVKHKEIINSKEIMLLSFNWDLSNHQNNTFQPMYALE